MQNPRNKTENQFGISGDAPNPTNRDLPLRENVQAPHLNLKKGQEDIHKKTDVSLLMEHLCSKDHSKGDACSTPSNEIKGKSVCICCLNTPKRKVKKVPKRIIYYEIPKPKFAGESVTVHDYKVWPIERRKPPAWHPKNSQPWKQLTVPCASETTYNMTFRPPPPRRLLSKRSQMDRE